MLEVKDVDFNGTILRAAQDVNKIIWVGVAWICKGLGLSDGQTKSERKKIQTDLVLSKGGRNFILPTGGGEQETLCLQLDFLPLWLAKIHITPRMKQENPRLVDNLITYQLKAKDVLAAAFFKEEIMVPSQPNYEHKIDELQKTIDKMYKDMTALANVILDWKENINSIPDKPLLITSESQWKQRMYEIIDHICDNSSRFLGRSDVMQWVYKYMNRNYGIVWEQEVREYKEQKGIIAKPSTIDVVEGKEILKSIFEAVLLDLRSASVKQRDKDFTKSDLDWVDSIIAPLIAKYHDGSNAGMATMRRVYRRMEKNYRICWKNLTTRYINQFGKKPHRKDLVNNSPTLRIKFRATVKELLEE